ncbi:MAG: FecR domain-containing protein [Thermodesulfobacteriota bacterium]
MTVSKAYQPLLWIAVVLLTAAFTLTAPAPSLAAAKVGTVTRVEGKVTVTRAGVKAQEVKVGAPVYLNDTFQTDAAGKARIVFIDQSIISVGPSSSLTITEYVFKPKQQERSSTLKLLFGKVKCFVNDYTGYKKKKFNVTTNTAVIGVRGTVFVVVVNPDGSTSVYCFQNEVFAQTAGRPGDFVIVVENMSTLIESGQLPTEPIPLTPEGKQLLEEGLFDVTPEGELVTDEGLLFKDTTTTYQTTTTTTTTTSTTTTTTQGTNVLPEFPSPPSQ